VFHKYVRLFLNNASSENQFFDCFVSSGTRVLLGFVQREYYSKTIFRQTLIALRVIRLSSSFEIAKLVNKLKMASLFSSKGTLMSCTLKYHLCLFASAISVQINQHPKHQTPIGSNGWNDDPYHKPGQALWFSED
jgi:hypothetical protein